MKSILNRVIEGILVINKEQKIEFCNDKLLTILKYTMDEVKALTLLEIFYDKEFQNSLIENKNNFKKGITFIRDKFNVSIKVSLEVCCEVFNEKECIFFIINEYKSDLYAKEDLEQLLDYEKITQIDTEEDKIEYEKYCYLESIRNDFFSNISHEFKTPLNIILSTIQLIDMSIESNKLMINGDFDFGRYKEAIKQNSYRLLRLINNLIDITTIDSGFYKLNLENYNIISIIEDVTMVVAQYVKSKGIRLIFDTDVEEMIIACDADKIEKVMFNLLSNAIKYSSINGEIIVNIKTTKNKIFVSVKDNGIGIPEDKIETIFDSFVQVDEILTRRCEGSGVGLSLVKSLIAIHGGSINVKSEIGKGSEFVFSLPIVTLESKNMKCENTLDISLEKCKIEFSDIYR